MDRNRFKGVRVDRIIEYLKWAIPHGRDPKPGDWEHEFCSGYQMGCEALIALGQATETRRGATPVSRPQLPKHLPRWDDMCCAILSLAQQRGCLVLLGAEGKPDWLPPFGKAPDAANIFSSSGLGEAYCKSHLLPVLIDLGLVNDNRWTAEAEMIFWRESPETWSLEFTKDARFLLAVDHAVKTLPDDVKKRIIDDLTVTASDMEVFRLKDLAIRENERRNPANPLRRASTFEQLRELGLSTQTHKIDSLFFQRWRLKDGWLDQAAQRKALDIFHDQLGIEMRRAVVARICPAPNPGA